MESSPRRPQQRRFLTPPPSPHLSRVVRTDGDAEIRVDEGVVDQVSHILEGLPMVFAGTAKVSSYSRSPAGLYP